MRSVFRTPFVKVAGFCALALLVAMPSVKAFAQAANPQTPAPAAQQAVPQDQIHPITSLPLPPDDPNYVPPPPAPKPLTKAERLAAARKAATEAANAKIAAARQAAAEKAAANKATAEKAEADKAAPKPLTKAERLAAARKAATEAANARIAAAKQAAAEKAAANKAAAERAAEEKAAAKEKADAAAAEKAEADRKAAADKLAAQKAAAAEKAEAAKAAADKAAADRAAARQAAADKLAAAKAAAAERAAAAKAAADEAAANKAAAAKAAADEAAANKAAAAKAAADKAAAARAAAAERDEANRAAAEEKAAAAKAAADKAASDRAAAAKAAADKLAADRAAAADKAAAAERAAADKAATDKANADKAAADKASADRAAAAKAAADKAALDRIAAEKAAADAKAAEDKRIAAQTSRVPTATVVTMPTATVPTDNSASVQPATGRPSAVTMPGAAPPSAAVAPSVAKPVAPVLNSSVVRPSLPPGPQPPPPSRAQPVTPAPAAAAPAPTSGVAAVVFLGADPYTPAELTPVTGIAIGSKPDSSTIQKASQRLIDTGLFSNVAASYDVNGALGTATFTLKPAAPDQLVRASFANFVWLTPAEINAALKSVAFYHGLVPLNGDLHMTQDIESALAAELKSKGITASISHSLVPPSVFHPYPAMEFRVTDPDTILETAQVFDVPPTLVNKMLKAQDDAVKMPYNEGIAGTTLNDVLLGPVREAGYLGARLTRVDKKRKSTPDAVYVDYTARLDAGPVYSVRSLNWTPSPIYTEADFKRDSALHVGQRPTPDAVAKTEAAILASYRAQGYLEATVSSSSKLTPESGAIDYTFTATPGPQYHLHSLTVHGLGDQAMKDFDGAWTIQPGDIYNEDYLLNFLNAHRNIASLNGYTFDYNRTTDPNTHEVDLTLTFKPAK